MNAITPLLFQETETSFCGYPLNAGQLLATAAAVGIATSYAIKKIGRFAFKPAVAKEDTFWETVAAVPTTAKRGPVIIMGQTIFPTLEEGQRQMALACNSTSEYVKTYLIRPNRKGTVLDLGCGIGANSLPLFQKGWNVIAIDKESAVIAEYGYSAQIIAAAQKEKRGELKLIHKDILQLEYREKVDAVIGVDLLPYIPPAQLKATMDKIFHALRPGGLFIGTFFFQPENKHTFTAELIGKLGAHFYPGKEVILEILTRSGFEIVIEKERENSDSDSFQCLEFLVKKPEIGAFDEKKS